MRCDSEECRKATNSYERKTQENGTLVLDLVILLDAGVPIQTPIGDDDDDGDGDGDALSDPKHLLRSRCGRGGHYRTAIAVVVTDMISSGTAEYSRRRGPGSALMPAAPSTVE